MKKLIIVTAQLNLLVGNIEGNTESIIAAAHQAYEKYGADLVVYPELAITGYPPEDLLFRPALYDRVQHSLNKLSNMIPTMTLVVGYPSYIDGKYYNSAAIITPGQPLRSYAKHELPNYHVFDEKRYFSPGSTPCIMDIRGVPIGVLICEDLWVEAPIEASIKAGAELIVCINASPFAQDKSHHRRHILKERSRKHQVPIIYVNLVGGQDELVFDGGSMVSDQTGMIVQQGDYFSEQLMAVEFNLQHPRHILTKQPTLPEPLDEEKIYHVLMLGVRDYIQKNSFLGAIVGLSGGIDSALTLAIAVDALGADAVKAVCMPSPFTAAMSIEDAQLQSKNLGITCTLIPIDRLFQVFLSELSTIFAGLPADVTEENLQARIRGTLLMALSNKTGSIVLTTGNKSEMAVGYATLYGDMAGGFAVLKDIYKTMIYRLCRYRNAISPVIPDRVLERAPSAELSHNQKDQDVLPPYRLLDEILERYIGQDQDPKTIAQAGYDIHIVKKIVRMVNKNEYKRRQAPVGIRITERAFGKDRRYPITSGFTKDI